MVCGYTSAGTQPPCGQTPWSGAVGPTAPTSDAAGDAFDGALCAAVTSASAAINVTSDPSAARRPTRTPVIGSKLMFTSSPSPLGGVGRVLQLFTCCWQG